MMYRSILIVMHNIVRNNVQQIHFSALSYVIMHISFHFTKHFLFYFIITPICCKRLPRPFFLMLITLQDTPARHPSTSSRCFVIPTSHFTLIISPRDIVLFNNTQILQNLPDNGDGQPIKSYSEFSKASMSMMKSFVFFISQAR